MSRNSKPVTASNEAVESTEPLLVRSNDNAKGSTDAKPDFLGTFIDAFLTGLTIYLIVFIVSAAWHDGAS